VRKTFLLIRGSITALTVVFIVSSSCLPSLSLCAPPHAPLLPSFFHTTPSSLSTSSTRGKGSSQSQLAFTQKADTTPERYILSGIREPVIRESTTHRPPWPSDISYSSLVPSHRSLKLLQRAIRHAFGNHVGKPSAPSPSPVERGNRPNDVLPPWPDVVPNAGLPGPVPANAVLQLAGLLS